MNNLEDLEKKINSELNTKIKELEDTISSDSVTSNFESSISIVDQLFEDLSEISGMEDFANNLDDLVSLMDSEEIEKDKILKKNEEVREVFEKEINWRKEASKSLLPELEKYNLIIKHNIGLRLQSRLTKDQAKFVAKCNSIHRDISLNF